MRIDIGRLVKAAWRLSGHLSTAWWIYSIIGGAIGGLVALLDGAPWTVIVFAALGACGFLGLLAFGFTFLASWYRGGLSATQTERNAELTRLMVELDAIIAAMRQRGGIWRCRGCDAS
jgi:hypothetical protein